MKKEIKQQWLKALDCQEYWLGRGKLWEHVHGMDIFCPVGVLYNMFTIEQHKKGRGHKVGFFTASAQARSIEPKIALVKDKYFFDDGETLRGVSDMRFSRKVLDWAGITAHDARSIALQNDLEGVEAAIRQIERF